MARTMALDTPAVEDAARRFLSRQGRRILGATLGLFLWAGSADGQVPGAFIEPFRNALEKGQAGTLRGTAVIEPRKPQEAPTPWDGVSIVLLPLWPRIVADLQAVKVHARDSATHYLEAAGDVRRLEDAYELALRQAGAAQLILRAVTDEAGRFELGRVPAGEWMLLGWHAELHRRAAPKIPLRDARGAFLLEPVPSGYRAVTYWLLTLTVKAGEEVTAELHDRNSWFRGVTEEKAQGVLQKKTP